MWRRYQGPVVKLLRLLVYFVFQALFLVLNVSSLLPKEKDFYKEVIWSVRSIPKELKESIIVVIESTEIPALR